MINQSFQKHWKFGVTGFITLFIVWGTVYFYIQARTTMRVASMVSKLGELRGSIILYHQLHERFPETLNDLAVCPEVKKDPLTGRDFLYMRPQEGASSMPMVMQPVAFRTRLWPFGEVRQYGFFANGEIEILRRTAGTGNE